MMTGLEVMAEAFAMFEKWRELFAPDDDRDILELASTYMSAPPEQHAAAAKAAGIKWPEPPS